MKVFRSPVTEFLNMMFLESCNECDVELLNFMPVYESDAHTAWWRIWVIDNWGRCDYLTFSVIIIIGIHFVKWGHSQSNENTSHYWKYWDIPNKLDEKILRMPNIPC